MIGNKLFYVDEVNSTNEYAKTLPKDTPEGAVVLADLQTAGRGRQGRNWYSPEGGLYMSVILRTPVSQIIPMMTGVAICQAFYSFDILLGLKWPNDTMLNGKKIAGVLCELDHDTVIVGIGINLQVKEFPPALKNIATSIFLETKKRFDKMMVFRTICKHLDEQYLLLKEDKVAGILSEWRNFTVMLGRNVVVELPEKTISGRAIDVGSDGSLILMLAGGKIERVVAGDCHILPKLDAQ